MSEPEANVSARAARMCDRIEQYVDSGHTIRALVELRALLDETGFWKSPDAAPSVREVYLKSVERFADLGVNEGELKISLQA